METNKYYVYLHKKLGTNDIFYVGKGSGDRAFDFSKSGRNSYWNNIKNKYGVDVEILFDNLSEEDAFRCEKDVILELEYFGYKLANITKGGGRIIWT